VAFEIKGEFPRRRNQKACQRRGCRTRNHARCGDRSSRSSQSPPAPEPASTPAALPPGYLREPTPDTNVVAIEPVCTIHNRLKLAQRGGSGLIGAVSILGAVVAPAAAALRSHQVHGPAAVRARKSTGAQPPFRIGPPARRKVAESPFCCPLGGALAAQNASVESVGLWRGIPAGGREASRRNRLIIARGAVTSRRGDLVGGAAHRPISAHSGTANP
jgi:hypothetical protein